MKKLDLFSKIEKLFTGSTQITYEMPCPVVLVLDKSGSMTGKPIKELNEGIKRYMRQIGNDEVASSRIETAIVAFGSQVEKICDFSLFNGNPMPIIKAEGYTLLAEGISMAIEMTEERKQFYKSRGLQYYKPFVILISDGYPSSSPERMAAIKQKINESVKAKKFSFWSFGVGNADMELLKDISAGYIPQKLDGYNFVKFFEWLSKSIAVISSSKPGEVIDITPSAEENPFQVTVE